MTREELREQLAVFLANGTEEKDFGRADMVLALFAQYDPFKEVLEFITLASSRHGGAQINTHWMHQALIRGGLSDTDRAFRERLIAHPPLPPSFPQGAPQRNVVAEKQATDRALWICSGCALIDQDCLPDGEGTCSKRKEKDS
jgi:hypothetical protein